MKITKQNFEKTNPELKKLRRTDPIQFSVLFNEWKRQMGG
jgi:hypothetical protein